MNWPKQTEPFSVFALCSIIRKNGCSTSEIRQEWEQNGSATVGQNKKRFCGTSERKREFPRNGSFSCAGFSGSVPPPDSGSDLPRNSNDGRMKIHETLFKRRTGTVPEQGAQSLESDGLQSPSEKMRRMPDSSAELGEEQFSAEFFEGECAVPQRTGGSSREKTKVSSGAKVCSKQGCPVFMSGCTRNETREKYIFPAKKIKKCPEYLRDIPEERKLFS